MMYRWVEYEHLFNTAAQPWEAEWPEFVAHLIAGRQSSETDKRLLPMWSPVRMGEHRRKKVNVKGVSMLVLDFDDGTPFGYLLPGGSVLWWCKYTTPSHTPEVPRFRYVIPLSREVDRGEYARIWKWAEALTEKQIDRACKDPSRAWACPVWGEAWPQAFLYAYEVREGCGPLDVEPILKAYPPPPKRKTLKEYIEEHGGISQEDARLLDPEFRSSLGEACGGTVSATRVKFVPCPRCKRESVWWWVDPVRYPLAQCNHRGTCGWRGSLRVYETIEQQEIDDALKG